MTMQLLYPKRMRQVVGSAVKSIHFPFSKKISKQKKKINCWLVLQRNGYKLVCHWSNGKTSFSLCESLAFKPNLYICVVGRKKKFDNVCTIRTNEEKIWQCLHNQDKCYRWSILLLPFFAWLLGTQVWCAHFFTRKSLNTNLEFKNKKQVWWDKKFFFTVNFWLHETDFSFRYTNTNMNMHLDLLVKARVNRHSPNLYFGGFNAFASQNPWGLHETQIHESGDKSSKMSHHRGTFNKPKPYKRVAQLTLCGSL